MLSLDEIMDDFHRNGRESDFTPVHDLTDRTWMYQSASPSWNAWPPEHATPYEKGKAFNVTSAHLRLAQAMSALSLSGGSAPSAQSMRRTPPDPQNSQRSQFCQHRGTKADRCGSLFGSSNDSMYAAEQANVLNFLQGNSLIHNELVKLIHEKAQELSEEYRSASCRQDDVIFSNGCDMVWNPGDSMMNVPMQAPRMISLRGKTRTSNWERYESGGIRFEHRPSQPTPRNSARHFNRSLNLKIRRDGHVEMDKYQYSPSTPSVASSTPTTPEPLHTPEEIAVQEVTTATVPKVTSNESVDQNQVASQSAPATPSPKSPGDGTSKLSSPQDPNSLKNPKEAGAGTGAGARTKGGQNRRRRYSSESQPLIGCTFCKKNGESPSIYKDHIVKDAGGRTVCRILQEYICPLCGATGEEAHTVKHCPKNPNPRPSPSEKFRHSRGGIHVNGQQKKSVNAANGAK